MGQREAFYYFGVAMIGNWGDGIGRHALIFGWIDHTATLSTPLAKRLRMTSSARAASPQPRTLATSWQKLLGSHTATYGASRGVLVDAELHELSTTTPPPPKTPVPSVTI
jgi:hypothetical protein